MADSREVHPGEKAKAKDVLEPGQTISYNIPKPRVIPVPRGTLQHIFGTSQVFQAIDDVKPKVSGLMVPLKVREYYHRGQGCLEQEDWETAVVFFSRALHLDPGLVDFYALRAEAFIQLCDFSSAVQNLRRAYSAQPENMKHLERLTFVLYLQGQCLYEHCNFEDALTVFLQALELQPEKPCFRYRSIACLLALQRHHDCLSFITKELRQGAPNADLYILRARIYNLFQMPNFCYRDLCSALRLDSRHPQARVLLQMMVDQAEQARQDAGTLAIQGRLQHALQRINCAIDNNPLDPRLFLFRGTMYRRLQEFNAAVEDFLRALDILADRPSDTVQQTQRQLLLTYNDFAVHCYKQGAYEEGVQLLNKALREEQSEKGLYINRGDCFHQLGHLAFAEADYSQALALNPQDQGAHMRMCILQERMGLRELNCRQFQKAEEHFSTAIWHNPWRAQCYLYRAKNRHILQDTFGARQDVITVLLLNPKQPKLLSLMASLFPGMSVEEVLSSQMGHLAKLQLEQMQLKRDPQVKIPQGIVGLRELERKKAQALQLSWKHKWPSSETPRQPEPTSQMLQMSPEDSGEDTEAFKGQKAEEETEELVDSEEARVQRRHHITGATAGPASSTAWSEHCSPRSPGAGTACRETGAPAAPEHRLSRVHPCVTWLCPLPQSQPVSSCNPHKCLDKLELTLSKVTSPLDSYLGHASTVSILGFRTSSTSKTETSTSDQEYRSSSTTPGMHSDSSLIKSSDSGNKKEVLPLSHQPRKSVASQAQKQGFPKATQSQGSSETEAAQGQRQKPSKTKATQGPRQRFRKTKAAHNQTWGQSQGSNETKSKVFQDPSGNLNNTKASWGQSSMPSETEAALGPGQGMSSSFKTDASRGLGQSVKRTKTGRSPDHHPVLQRPE
nr:tetratricopeptide repeat protein 16 [Cavia porcellus]